MLLHGYIAVDIFFILSGFVMALSYAHMFERFSLRQYAVFMVRRIGRIYPLYFVIAAVIFVGLNVGLGRRPDYPPLLEAAIYNFLLIQNWGLSYSLIIASWSISTELAAYVLFPILLAVTVQGRRPSALAALTISALALTWMSQMTFPDLTHGPLDIYFDFSPWPLVRCFAEFTIGLLVYRLAQSLKASEHAFVPRLARLGPVCLVAFIALLAVRRSDLMLLALFAALVVAVALDEAPVARWLASPIPYALGELSYATYLLHWEFMRVGRIEPYLTPYLGEKGAALATDAAFFGCILVAAWYCYNVIEKPGRDMVRRWGRGLEAPVGPVVGARRS